MNSGVVGVGTLIRLSSARAQGGTACGLADERDRRQGGRPLRTDARGSAPRPESREDTMLEELETKTTTTPFNLFASICGHAYWSSL